MKKALIVLCLFGLLAGGVAGCAALTDTANRRASADMSEDDLRVTREVLNRLQDDVVTGQLSIGAESSNGVVTLYGSVPDDVTRHRVLNVVRGAPGVMSINDRLTR